MHHSLFLAGVYGLVVLCGQIAPAEEHVLTIEVVTETELGGGAATEKVTEACSLEVLTWTNRRFRAKGTWGDDSLSATGRVTKSKEEGFDVEITLDAIHCGEKMPGPSGILLPESVEKTRINTTVRVIPGKALEIGGLLTRSDVSNDAAPAAIAKESTRRRVVRIQLDEPSE